MDPGAASIADKQIALDRPFDIVLKPVSHPELSAIRIDHALFAVGRTNAPFASARPELVADLSRRHARVFFEAGAAYVADLGSKNGTAVNGIDVSEKPHALHDGDELRFGGALTYRVAFVPRAAQQRARTAVVTLTPERADLGLQPVVITAFPFLVSKADDTFACYRHDYPHQVNYLSRRHAHIYVQDDDVFVEDLGSTNGTFVDGRRLAEHAAPLEDGAVLALGGDHFVYRVGVQRGAASDPTVTATSTPGTGAASAADLDRTTFVGTAHSFLDIFCTPVAVALDDEVNPQAAPSGPQAAHDARRRRGRFEVFLSELSEALGGTGRIDMRRLGRWSAGVGAALVVLLAALYASDAPQREMSTLLARGDTAQAAQLADRYLATHRDDTAFRAMGVEALIRSAVPDWIAAMNARGFDRARAIVQKMRTLARYNPDAQPLVNEIAWIGELEAFVVGRGGPGAPIRIYRDEAPIDALTSAWNDNPSEHQQRLERIAAYVPEFDALYADALSHLRALQSDQSVYVAALGRLKHAIGAALDADRLDTLPATISDYAQRYPRLAGLDAVQADLQQYQQLESDARAAHGQGMPDRVRHARFATPQFAAHAAALERLASSGERGEARQSP
ncbi:FHA domain-containing protein [Burkholderia guangdongensis]|uniref:FHA domain-containing protein n=1 Tax=Burkholderia guangdongensis TaxID=1792500 RepID=UPI0015C7A646|nr:FHA domain-containing protein [Burkholderia guangdongensis]